MAAVLMTIGVQAAFALRGEPPITSKSGKGVTQVKVVRGPNESAIGGKRRRASCSFRARGLRSRSPRASTR
jgi:hypothetical protein